MTKAKPTKAARKAATDRIAIPGGAACPRCAAMMQRYERPSGCKPPNDTPFHLVQTWDRCLSCSWIQRLDER
jgi:hypothetical protein